MSGGNDEVDGAGHKRRIAGTHQLFRRLAFASAFDDWLATGGEGSARTARADFVVFSHRPSLHRFYRLRRSKTGDMMRATWRTRTMQTTRTGRLTTLLVLISLGLVGSLLSSPQANIATAQDDPTFEDEMESGKKLLRQRRYDEALKSFK